MILGCEYILFSVINSITDCRSLQSNLEGFNEKRLIISYLPKFRENSQEIIDILSGIEVIT